MSKKIIKSVSARFSVEAYISLKNFQSLLLQKGVDIGLNNIIEGCVKAICQEGVSEKNIALFQSYEKKKTASDKSKAKNQQTSIPYN
ncbi:MAG: hypothetical protein MI674_00160 [Cytophagales bacterium]|nr:hypothetical protein [Cytophagales bacterium]